MTCTGITALVKLVALDAFKSNIFTHYLAMNTTIITQYSDKKICNSNSFNKLRETVASVFVTNSSFRKMLNSSATPQFYGRQLSLSVKSLPLISTFVFLQNISIKIM